MSFKSKIINTIIAHPTTVTFGIGMAITFVVGAAIGTLGHGQLALAVNANSGGNT